MVSAVQYSILFAFIGGVFGLLSLSTKFDRKAYEAIRKNIRSLIILGLASGLAVGILVFGQRYTTSVNAALLVTSSIVATSLFSYVLLGEKLAKKQAIWVVMLFVGLYIGIVGLKKIQLRSGDLIIMGSVLFFGFGNAFSRVIMKRMDRPGIVPDMRLIVAGTISIVLALLTIRNFSVIRVIWPLALLSGLFYWLCMKTFARSVHLLNANEAVILNQSQIFFTSLAGVVILSEHYSPEKFIGSVIVIVSIYFITAHKRVSTTI